jgi:LytS/YehU family sensor histidine kinase
MRGSATGCSFRIEISPEVQEAYVPTFLLQPLVENAVRHGLEPRSGEGLLEIRATREGDQLHVTVSDNGAGLPQNSPSAKASVSRIHALDCANSTATAPASELRNAGGLSVIIKLPFRTTL